jgi:hypothetical protein
LLLEGTHTSLLNLKTLRRTWGAQIVVFLIGTFVLFLLFIYFFFLSDHPSLFLDILMGGSNRNIWSFIE